MDQTDFRWKTIKEIVEALTFLRFADGEPAAGGEQAHNRNHLYEIAQRIKEVRAALVMPEQDVMGYLLFIAQKSFLDLSAYREVEMGTLNMLLCRFEPMVHPRPPIVVADPGPVPRAFALQAPEAAVEALARLLKITITDLTQALITLERQGYTLASKVS